MEYVKALIWLWDVWQVPDFYISSENKRWNEPLDRVERAETQRRLTQVIGPQEVREITVMGFPGDDVPAVFTPLIESPEKTIRIFHASSLSSGE